MNWMQTTQPERKPLVVSPVAKGLFRKRGILLIDDDEFFCALFQAVADSLGIPARTYSSLADMTSFAELRNYDVAVLDYYLQSFRGPEIAEYIDVFFNELPVVVISGGEIADLDQKVWPSCIRKFVPKSNGPYAILQRALEAAKNKAAV